VAGSRIAARTALLRSRVIPRRLGLRVTPAEFVRISVVALIGLLIIIPSGAYVRLTASGLGCPDWPLCNGRVLPANAGHALIEYSNRILSAAVMVACIVTWLAARGLPGRPRAVRALAAAIALTTAGQGPLGAATVLFDLHPLLVASHFLLSMLALAAGTVLVLVARDHASGVSRRLDRRHAPLAALTALALGVGIATGMLVTAAGPHSGDAAVVRRFGNLDDAAWLHLRAVLVFAGLALLLVGLVWREGSAERATRRLGLAAVPLIGLQIGIGEYQYRNHLPWEVVGIHVTVAGLVWATTIALLFRVARPRAPAPAPPAAPA
jgi:heme a synthase